jgi:chloramphenicol O-acetyltransferase type B
MGINIINIVRKVRIHLLVHLKWRKYSFGTNPYIGRLVYMWAKDTIRIGDNFYIGKFSQIECSTEIGNNVIFANNVALVGRYDHNYQQIGVPTRLASQIRNKDYNWKGLNEKIIIEDDVWIGYGSIILSGVKIGQGSIIAAGSVVCKDIEPFSINAGVPAKKIKDRFNSEIQKREHLRLYNLNYSKILLHS